MAFHSISDDLAREAAALLEKHGSQQKAAKAAGLSRSAFQNRLKRAAERGFMGFVPVLPGYRVSRSAVEQGADGKTVRQWIEQKPERGDVFKVPAGQVVKGVSALVDEDGREIVKWVKTREDAATSDALSAIKAAFDDYSPAPPIPAPTVCDDDLLTAYPLPDLHLGMHAWGRETGESYDLKIAAERARQMAGALIAQSRPSREALVLGLGDLFHMNDRTNMTPRSGHILDVDGRWPKVFSVGVRLVMDLIEFAAQKHEIVRVRFLAGNHDPDAAIALTVALSIFYAGNPRIVVDDNPSLVFYHRFGRVLLGATHGHTMKPERMAMMLATDRPEDWGATTFKHMFFGHVHHESAKEIGPVRVESFNTPASKDAHAHGGGYRSGQSLNAITFHREQGEIGRHRVNLVPALKLAA